MSAAFTHTALRHIILFAVCVFFASCSARTTALIWTDRPEVALYAQSFNTHQSNWTMNVRYTASPMAALRFSKEKPDIIIAHSLLNRASFKQLTNLSYLFKKQINAELFYSALLSAGREGNAQRVIPIAFNLPFIVYSKQNNAAAENNIEFIELDTLRKKSGAYNKRNGNTWERLGFSPLWDKEHRFLFMLARFYHVDFAEAPKKNIKEEFLIWNEEELNATMNVINAWIEESAGSIQADDDFIYKYFFNPPDKLLHDKRILFAFMRSDEYWLLSSERQAALEYRLLSHEGCIPLDDDIVSLGIYKYAKAKKAAAAFTAWLLSEAAQDNLLKLCRENHLTSSLFGIAGGFSSLQTVTARYFPKYYEGLLGRTPPVEALVPPSALPENWQNIKSAVILPYLLMRLRGGGVQRTLTERLDEWRTIQRGAF